ncbi:MAG: DUF2807 domain-containing protein [Bacteroidetes bacterium]|nr:DUF2807 domain-containing protein [Bacteroidota bacterium]
MPYLKNILILSIISMFFFSCNKQNACDCFKPRGHETTEIRAITTPFNTIQAFDKIEVYYKQDTTLTNSTISVETGSNLMSNITTQVVDSVLQIKNNNKCNFVRGDHNGVSVYITAPHVRYFIQDGVGNIYSQNTLVEKSIDYNLRNSGNAYLQVNTQSLWGHIFGIGDAHVSGQTQQHFVNVQGESFLYAHDLTANYCFILYNATGEAHVNVNGELDAVVQYTGNIYYSGAISKLNKQISGSGNIIPEP